MTFPLNTYVVLEVPSPWAERVLQLRRLQRDFFRYPLPAETTLFGSNGVGPKRDPVRYPALRSRPAGD